MFLGHRSYFGTAVMFLGQRSCFGTAVMFWDSGHIFWRQRSDFLSRDSGRGFGRFCVVLFLWFHFARSNIWVSSLECAPILVQWKNKETNTEPSRRLECSYPVSSYIHLPPKKTSCPTSIAFAILHRPLDATQHLSHAVVAPQAARCCVWPPSFAGKPWATSVRT
jgi:hypothetical protein